MKQLALVSMISIFPANFLWAQLDLLTPREVVRIVEQTPPVVEAAKKLKCPVLAQIGGDPRQAPRIDVEVRAACGSFHDRYAVDRRTGNVTTWGDNPSKVGGEASESLAKELVRKARDRVLSFGDSRCLALEAVRSLPGWSTDAGSTTIEAVGTPPDSPATLFSLSRTSSNPPTEIRVMLYVDPTTGHVRNEALATEIASAGLGGLLSDLIALRSPVLLSDQDALSIALRIPSLAAFSHRKNCSLIASSTFTPDQAQVAPACEGHYLDHGGVAVNLRDGLVFDADTGEAIDAQQVTLFARSLVLAVRSTRTRVQAEVEAKCVGLAPAKPRKW